MRCISRGQYKPVKPYVRKSQTSTDGKSWAKHTHTETLSYTALYTCVNENIYVLYVLRSVVANDTKLVF